MRLLAFSLLLLLGALGVRPNDVRAQGVSEVLAAIRNGGGWVAVPIERGRGTASTLMLPTMGMQLSGCVRVWDGHSGTWRIRARDTIGLDSLEVSSAPGEGIRFSHEFGLRSQLEVDFEWSEPRDTTLFLWVGLDRQDDGPDEACIPKS